MTRLKASIWVGMFVLLIGCHTGNSNSLDPNSLQNEGTNGEGGQKGPTPETVRGSPFQGGDPLSVQLQVMLDIAIDTAEKVRVLGDELPYCTYHGGDLVVQQTQAKAKLRDQCKTDVEAFAKGLTNSTASKVTFSIVTEQLHIDQRDVPMKIDQDSSLMTVNKSFADLIKKDPVTAWQNFLHELMHLTEDPSTGSLYRDEDGGIERMDRAMRALALHILPAKDLDVYAIDQALGLSPGENGNLHLNYHGKQELWFKGQVNSFAIIPTGKLHLFQNAASPLGFLISELGSYYYENVHLLHDAPRPDWAYTDLEISHRIARYLDLIFNFYVHKDGLLEDHFRQDHRWLISAIAGYSIAFNSEGEVKVYQQLSPQGGYRFESLTRLHPSFYDHLEEWVVDAANR